MTEPELKSKRRDGITFYPSLEIKKRIRELAYIEETSQTALIREALVDLFAKRNRAKKEISPK